VSEPTNDREAAKDATEWKHFEMFRRVLADFPVGHVEKVKPPAADFRVDTSHGPLGIELARIIDSPLREEESLRRQAVEAGRIEYVRRGRPAVEAHFGWIRSPRTGRESKHLGSLLANLVESHIPRETGQLETVQLRDAELKVAGLGDLLFFVRIIRFPGLRTLWASSDGGWFDARSEVVHQRVAEKTQKLPEYRLSCSKVWLLLVADGEGVSGVVDKEALAQVEVESSFDRIYFLDFWSAHLYPLRVLHPVT
jgi:hypothetical protein